MLNFRAAHQSGDGEDESERKMEIQNKKETYEIFTKSKKNDKSQIKNKINDEGKLENIFKCGRIVGEGYQAFEGRTA